jgi:hypothetical protein
VRLSSSKSGLAKTIRRITLWYKPLTCMFFEHNSGRLSPSMIYEDASFLKDSALRSISAEENAPNF